MTFRSLVSRASQGARYAFMRGINTILKERPDKVVFASFNGDAYADNPRSISEALHQQRPNLDLVWLIKNPSEKRDVLPSYVRCVRFRSIRALYELSTARAWVDNTTKAPYVYKSPRQFYMQTWHGDRGFKTMLLDSPNYLAGRRMVERESDLILTGSAHAERVYRSAFRYEGKFLRRGSPRNDLLIQNDQDKKASVRSALGIPLGAKVLLYAPTYRHEDAACFRAQTVELDVGGTLEALEHGGARWVCLLRGHSKVRGLKDAGNDPRVLDANSWEDMAELLLVADMLISDYSSSVGDFALTGRPILLFQPDFARFRGERTFYFDMDASPFWIARDQAALEERIEKLTPEASALNDREILDFFGSYETGDATSAAVRAILDAIDAY